MLIPPIANAANPSANARARSTLCVSSQVGCRQGCRFCATGTMGFFRSLTLDEILAQVFAARALVASSDELPPLSNLVFMGMESPPTTPPSSAAPSTSFATAAALGSRRPR